jgi:protein involved in polysaccharide export with SLBB domain
MRVLLLTALLLGACTTTATTDYQKVTFDTSEAILASALSPSDVFEVRVHGHDDLSGLHRVSPEGDIDFPLIKRVRVVGLTSSQIADLIREKLMQGYLRSPTVTVYVKEVNSKKIFVFGQVAKPGAFLYEDGMNVVQAIALAGGFSTFAQQNNVKIKRRNGDKESTIDIPVERIVTDPGSTNFRLVPGDIVYVPENPL